MKKKLIEVALPLEEINREAAREKSIRHGHPSTLHLWWARRPLAACRAVLFAQLADDPSAHPEEFPTEEAQAEERERLFRIIEALVKWENSNNEEVLEAARAEIRKSCGGNPPPILDPFAGGGSIPLEAQRLGLEAHASDLNPVAVLICKALIEIPPKWAGRPPVHPREGRLGNETWTGAQGLAEDVRYYGAWMRDEAERRIGHLYPKAKLPDGSEATVIAWIWARTVTCPNPACGATMPLVRSFWLGKKKGKEAWVDPVVEGKTVRFEIGHGKGGPPDPPKVGRGAKFRCLVCDQLAPDAHLKAEGMAGRIGAQLMATVAKGDRERIYLAPSDEHVCAADVERPEDAPEGAMPENPRWFSPPAYGMTEYADLFTNRQLVALTTFSDLVGEARDRVESDARTAGLSADDARSYATAVATYLAFAVDRGADYWSTISTWALDFVRNTFARQALPMTWDFVEANPMSTATGNWLGAVEWITRVLEQLLSGKAGTARQADAATLTWSSGAFICTDPPYYDNIGYADLSDFFYVWLRRALRLEYPELFATLLSPKAEELVATPYRFKGDRGLADEFFEDGFVQVFTRAQSVQRDDAPLTFFYAFKEADDQEEGVTSRGWETMLTGLLQAGWTVTATWPMRTERTGRTVSLAGNTLASSVVLACRPRHETAGVTDRRSFIAALRQELPHELTLLRQGGIAPVDLPQAAIGPGMAVFSRYARVIEPSGDPMSVRAALGIINEVLAEVLDEQEGDFDPDTRWAIKWFEQRGMDQGPSGEAIDLARAYGTTLEGLERSGVARASRGKTWLVPREEMPGDWDPASDRRLTIWEATQHLVRRLLDGGEQAAADLLRELGGVGETAQLLAYRLYSICERRGWAKEAGPYNALGGSWKEIQRHAQRAPEGAAEQMAMGEA